MTTDPYICGCHHRHRSETEHRDFWKSYSERRRMIQGAKKHRKRNKTLIKQIGSSKGALTERKRALRILGFRTYKDYLASDLWQSIRLRVLDRDGGLCRGCGKRATQVHHTNYNLRTMDGRNIQPLWSVCRWCHQGSEFLGSSKTTIGQANLRILRRPQ